MKFRAITWNVRHRNEDYRIKNAIRGLMAYHPDFICLQEMGGHQDAVPPGNGVATWGSWIPPVSRGEGRADCPILWNTDRATILRFDSILASEARTVEEGAGGSTVPDKVFTWAKFQLGTRRMSVINLHMIPTVEGANGMPNVGNPKRLALYNEHMALLERMVTRRLERGQLVLVAGDFNVNWRKDSMTGHPSFPSYKFHKWGIQTSFDVLGAPQQSSDYRLIDYLAHGTRYGTFRPVDQTLLLGFPSDHKPLLVTYEVK